MILDVVYNHTAEGNQLGPTLSFRGIDNAAYYRLSPEDPRYYMDFTGCGNTLNMRTRACCSSSWTACATGCIEMHVDGFRFDLASTLARELHEVDQAGRVLRHHPPGPGPVAGEADRRAVGRRRRAATRSATSPCCGPSGTASTATASAASGRATAARVANSPRGLAARSDLYE